jgi:hypothetical protein
LESSPSGDYRIKDCSGNTTTFLKALATPNFPLGDTTIICLDAEEIEDTASVVKDPSGTGNPARQA